MEIKCIGYYGFEGALFGLGLSYNLTSQYDDWQDVAPQIKEKVYNVATKLAGKGGGEDKFLRQIFYQWDALLPRFLWQEVDQYRIGVTTQSQSTMHTIMHRELAQEDFEKQISYPYLYHLNLVIKKYKETQNKELFLQLKNDLPEGFLQRRVWSLTLAQMLNIYRQRINHRLPQWKETCKAFEEATPSLFKGIYLK